MIPMAQNRKYVGTVRLFKEAKTFHVELNTKTGTVYIGRNKKGPWVHCAYEVTHESDALSHALDFAEKNYEMLSELK